MNKKQIIAILLFAPFLLIPFTGIVLKIGVYLSEKLLPNWMIVMKIDMSDNVTLSTFIYYYTCFLAIEVTALLSYAVYKLSLEKEVREIEEKKKRIELKIRR